MNGLQPRDSFVEVIYSQRSNKREGGRFVQREVWSPDQAEI